MRAYQVKERLITFICALGALALFFTMFLHDDSHGLGGAEVPRPTTEERGAKRLSGSHAMARARAHSHNLAPRTLRSAPQEEPDCHRQRVDRHIARDCVFKTEEFRPLDHWVREGNTLLVLAALSDTPDWAFSFGGMTSGDLNLLTGLEFESSRNRDLRAKKLPDSKDTIVRLPLHFSAAAHAIRWSRIASMLTSTACKKWLR